MDDSARSSSGKVGLWQPAVGADSGDGYGGNTFLPPISSNPIQNSIFEQVGGLPQGTLPEPKANTVPAVNNQTGGLPPWLQAKTQDLPQVVQNSSNSGQPVGTLPGVYYPKAMEPATRPMPLPEIKAAPIPIPQPVSVPKEEPKVPMPPPPTIAGGNIISQTEATSFIVPLVFGVLVFIGTIYALCASLFVFLGYKYNATIVEANGINLYFLKEQPMAGLLPVILAIAAVMFWWVGVMVKSGTRKAWVMGILISIGVPVMVGLLGNFIWQEVGPLVQMIADYNLRAFLTIQYLAILPALILLVSFKAFGRNPSYQDQKSKGLVGLVIVFFGFLVLGALGVGYVLAYNGDDGYQVAKQAVTFKVYKPKALPSQRTTAIKYQVNQNGGMLNGRKDFVQVTFDYSGLQQRTGKLASPIILRQVDVPQDFDAHDFAVSLLGETASPTAILVQAAVNNEAYTLEAQGKNGNLRIITFKTPDNILVFLSSATAPLNDMIMLSNNLE